jgi:hypothetical protein
MYDAHAHALSSTVVAEAVPELVRAHVLDPRQGRVLDDDVSQRSVADRGESTFPFAEEC